MTTDAAWPRRADAAEGASAREPGPRGEVVALVLAGFCFGGGQQVLLREFAGLLYGEEVVLLLVATAALAAASLGYRLGGRLGPRALAALLLACGALQLLSPGLPRLAVAGLCRLRGGSGPELLAVLGVCAFVAAAPFAALLPALLVRQVEPHARLAALRRTYTAELLGFGLGTAAATALGDRPGLRLGLHALGLVGLVHVALGRPRWTLAFAGAAALLCAVRGPLAQAGADAVYRHKHRIPGATVLWSVDSAHQRVEVVQAPGRGMMLYLDGLRDLDERDLAVLNHYLARAPARLLRPARALLLGNGTLSLVPELAALSGELLTVEIDPAVVDAGARFFTPAAPLAKLRNWGLIAADGKAFLAATDQDFDMIAVDLPSPLTLGEAYLHTREFYALCRSRLRPGGVLAVQLSGGLGDPGRTPARLIAGLRAAFEDVAVVDSALADRAFAYASDALPFDEADLRASAAPGERGLTVLRGPALAARIGDAQPLTLDDLDLVLRRGAERLRDRHF